MSQFVVYPAIDIRGGKCVRLLQGDYNQETVFNDQPAEVAKTWQAQGAEWIHVVDLDGAKEGKPVNHRLIGKIAGQVDIPLQVGGGLRSERDIEQLLQLGAARVIIGSAAIENREFVKRILKKYGDRIAVGIDARDGYAAIHGWLETSHVKAEDLAKDLADYGARTFIFTDISKDGMMEGPNVEAVVALAKASGQSVIASGGVSRSDDLLRLQKHTGDGVTGAIVGKALYTGDISLQEANALLYP